MNTVLLYSILASFLPGLWLLLSSFREKLRSHGRQTPAHSRTVPAIALAGLFLSAVLCVLACFSPQEDIVLFYLLRNVPILLSVDALGKWFLLIITLIWVAVGCYSVIYLTHEGEEKRFFGFYLLLYGVLIGLCSSGNLITFYLFYELMTLASFPLVLHNGTREALMASLKYLFYSMCGAYMGLFGIFFLQHYLRDLTFTEGGVMTAALLSQHGTLFPIVILVTILGFSVKAGMFPLHAWLPAAHPVAPSPASAVLSGVIVKCGALGIIRVLFYVAGPSSLEGTFVPDVLRTLSLITVFLGSLLAFREKVLKKRLAYSTVSQMAYILFGLFSLTPESVSGALLHVLFHAVIKSGLFLTAGIFIFSRGITRVDDLKGVGKKMPATMFCYTIFALALVGIPPTSGFISKWYLAQGALSGDIGMFRFLGPAILLVSALLTAGYLLPIALNAFFCEDTAKDADDASGEPSLWMLAPLVVLAALALCMGVFPDFFTQFASGIADTLF